MAEHYIGLISGTSMDGIDAVLASFADDRLSLHATHSHDYPDELRRRLEAAKRNPAETGLDRLGQLDRWVGECFRDAALAVIEKSGIAPRDVVAIGSHGQTLRHRPDVEHPYSLQIGDAATIAAGTGVTTVSDFRRADIAAGGQGAPLVPPFHDWLFRDRDSHCAVVNIGGIANLTILPGGSAAVTGFDTGPGNTLLDAWIVEQRGQRYDQDGQWAASGNVIQPLLETLMADDYFQKPAPKSTGFEYFNLDWLSRHRPASGDPQDVQATLAELTAQTVAAALERHAPATRQVYVCGGGAHNQDLLSRLARRLDSAGLSSTADAGLDPDWVEATAFAWLAMRTMNKQSGNLPSVTGASHQVVLGAIHLA
ncbi:MAG: anhydro-N-acetylmuramic acid kinase [Woeseiaceae bacterium]|nr:anhydro-N-acetylmuramic acid kinase [Woeseiaceae bacterium]